MAVQPFGTTVGDAGDAWTIHSASKSIVAKRVRGQIPGWRSCP